MKGVSLFASAGIGELFLKDLGIEIVVANELLEKRANLYRSVNPDVSMICGDITEETIFNKIMNSSPKKVDFLIASPPCQGMSIAGKNRSVNKMIVDERNYLIFRVFDFISIKMPDFIIIENVPALIKLKLRFNNKLCTVVEILQQLFGEHYNIDFRIVDAVDYGVPQFRKRAIIKLYKKGFDIVWPKININRITVRDSISYLPSLEAGENSNIKWHFARKHDSRHIEWMKHTPTGHSAFENDNYIPRKKDGTLIKGYNTTYRRIEWDLPAPTITIRNDAISSQRNVHPGRLLKDGTYSDARVLTPLELMILSSIPISWGIPNNTSEILIRQCIGECIPPLLIKRLLEDLKII